MECYLDNAATTKPCSEAIESMHRCLSQFYGNPGSLHSIGLSAQKEVDKARFIVSKALGCTEQEVFFTSGATESNNLALQGTALHYGKRRKKIIVSAVEHASVKNTVNYLREKYGFQVVFISPDKGGIYHAEDFLKEVDDNTFLVSMMLVNNENGYCLPVQEVFHSVKRKDNSIITHCDAVQGFLKIPFKAKTLFADLISISGHKIHAAKGVGALYKKKGVNIQPLFYGGSQEHSLRPGTENVPLIAGFGEAVRKYLGSIDERYKHVQNLKYELLSQLSELNNVHILSDEKASPYIVSFSVPPIRSEIFLHYLEKKNIFVSSGSACSKGVNSGVPALFGASSKEEDSILRVSFSSDTSVEEIYSLISAIKSGQNEIMTY